MRVAQGDGRSGGIIDALAASHKAQSTWRRLVTACNLKRGAIVNAARYFDAAVQFEF
jgi:hypothetical protein